MAITLGPNIDAAKAIRRLGEASNTFGERLSRLSTGQRIDNAGDDAAGLAVAEELNTKRRLHGQAVRNINDSLSALSIMDAALTTQMDIAARLQELAQQASNGNYSGHQREVLNGEYQALVAEMHRVAATVKFNNLPLLRGGTESNPSLLNVQLGVSGSAASSIPITLTNTGSLGGWVDYTRLGGDVVHDGVINANDLFELDSDWIGCRNEFGDDLTVDEIALHWGGSYSGRALSQVPVYVVQMTDSEGQQRDLALVLTYTFLGGTGSGAIPPDEVGLAVYEKNESGTYDFSAMGGAGYVQVAFTVNQQTGQITSTTDVDLGAGTTVPVDLRGLTLRSGAYHGSTTALEFSGLETVTRARDALSISEAWGGCLAVTRSQVGAMQSRLQSSLKVNEAVEENVARARSGIMDADSAAEAAGMVAAKVRRDAATAVLAHANRSPRIILDLLG